MQTWNSTVSFARQTLTTSRWIVRKKIWKKNSKLGNKMGMERRSEEILYLLIANIHLIYKRFASSFFSFAPFQLLNDMCESILPFNYHSRSLGRFIRIGIKMRTSSNFIHNKGVGIMIETKLNYALWVCINSSEIFRWIFDWLYESHCAEIGELNPHSLSCPCLHLHAVQMRTKAWIYEWIMWVYVCAFCIRPDFFPSQFWMACSKWGWSLGWLVCAFTWFPIRLPCLASLIISVGKFYVWTSAIMTIDGRISSGTNINTTGCASDSA